MAKVRFVQDFDYRPSEAPGAVLAYQAGKTYTVKRECADQAVAAGAAQLVAGDLRFNGAPAEAFDHDGDGQPGGSVPAATPSIGRPARVRNARRG